MNDVLETIRSRAMLAERRPGIFYRRGKAFLHFHEDPSGLFADLRDDAEWRRFPVTSPNERKQLVVALDRALNNEDRSAPK